MAAPITPAKKLANGKDTWWIVPAVADSSAPTVTEVNATTGMNLAGSLLSDYEGVTSSTDVNDYLAETMGGPFTAKDFRTWGASTAVTEFLASEARSEIESEILAAIDATAEKLGNTREVCRDSYVHPSIPDAYREGSLREAWVRSRSGRWLTRPESTVNRLLRGT